MMDFLKDFLKEKSTNFVSKSWKKNLNIVETTQISRKNAEKCELQKMLNKTRKFRKRIERIKKSQKKTLLIFSNKIEKETHVSSKNMKIKTIFVKRREKIRFSPMTAGEVRLRMTTWRQKSTLLISKFDYWWPLCVYNLLTKIQFL